MDCESADQLKVGMSWILNDGGAPWYNAVELGLFNDVCLEADRWNRQVASLIQYGQMELPMCE